MTVLCLLDHPSDVQVQRGAEAIIDVSLTQPGFESRLMLFLSWRTPDGRTGEWVDFAEV